MIGGILISHGKLAEGMKNALEMFFGENIEAFACVSLTPEKSVDAFKRELEITIDQVEQGQGVVIFADLYGGTPFNQAIQEASDSCRLISGMNLAMVMEFLVDRLQKENMKELSCEEIMNIGKEGIQYSEGLVSVEDEEEEL